MLYISGIILLSCTFLWIGVCCYYFGFSFNLSLLYSLLFLPCVFTFWPWCELTCFSLCCWDTWISPLSDNKGYFYFFFFYSYLRHIELFWRPAARISGTFSAAAPMLRLLTATRRAPLLLSSLQLCSPSASSRFWLSVTQAASAWQWETNFFSCILPAFFRSSRSWRRAPNSSSR